MRFIDEARIFVRSGAGGNGCVSFRREKYVPHGGPNGGNGGNGGDVLIVADSQDLNLYDLQFRRNFRARRGEHGKGSDKHGKGAPGIVIHVPPGTLIWEEEKRSLLVDLDKPGQSFVAAKGGRGGRGNGDLTTTTNRLPRECEPGAPGEEKWLVLELKMIADAGLIGFPSVGKSTLIAAISQARPKIAAYPFTTLSPNLGAVVKGVADRFVVADLPGLIEGAHAGAGLGHKFLRHIERTRVLVHLLDMDPATGRDPVKDYAAINEELRKFNPRLLDKPQIVAANKIDLPEAKERLKKTTTHFRRKKLEVIPISAKDGAGLDKLLDAVEKAVAAYAPAPAENPEAEG